MASAIRWSDLNLERLLGEGQAGQVWLASIKRAVDGLSAGQKVAVKRYKPWIFQEPGQHERVFRELAASAKVLHPNVIENICLVTDPDSFPALVMKYYEGITLDTVLALSRSSGGRLPLERAFELLVAMIDGASALHSAGIYHRDIKPSNVLVESSSGRAILMDLGVVSNFLLPEQTETKSFLGTIRYAHPVYLRGNPFTAAHDWYSIGLIGFELCFNRQIFRDDENWANVVAKKLARGLPSKKNLGEECESTTEVFGHSASEAIFTILSRLMFDFSDKNLQFLRKALSKNFWTNSFFEAPGGEIVLGSPPQVSPYEVEPTYFGKSQVGVSGEEWEDGLRRYVKSRYWDWKVDGRDISGASTKSFDQYSVYAGGSGDDTTYDWVRIHAGTMAAYRYGYL